MTSPRDWKDRTMKRWFALAALSGGRTLGSWRTAHPATAQTAEQLEQQYGREAMAQALDVKRRYDLYGIHFETGKAAIQQESQALLDDIAAVMKQFPDWRLEIAGHTDAAGDPAQNEALSRARADAVKAALVQRGIEAGRLEPEGDGRGAARRQQRHAGRPRAQPARRAGPGGPEAQHPVHHGRRHRLDAALDLPSGLMVGETPNIDRIGREGAKFTDYYAEQSCTAGRNAFFTGMYPLRTGMIPPQLPGSPSYLRPGTPALAKFLHDLGYTTGEFGKNHLGDHTDVAADRARLPGILGLPLPPRRDAGGELPRHQQDPDRADAWRRPARTRRSRACPRCRVRSTRRPRPA